MATDTRSVSVDGAVDVAGPVSVHRRGRPAGVRRRPAWQARPIGYQPALDGLRALAVGVVVAYHLGYARAAGGYIGVEVFFVLSGWLVCALLMNERHRTGGIALRRFWLRRARRLLPALGLVTAVTLAVASVVRPERLAELRTHGVAALAYHLNWRLVLDQRSYFEAAQGPSALEHLWSLSIEEQFYVLFPLAAVVLARWPRRRAVAVVAAVAAATTVLRFALHDPAADPSRIYFGTDTRAAGLLLGVAVALFWTPNRLRPHSDPRFTAALDGLAAAGAAVLAWYVLVLDEHHPLAFRGGFTAAQLATLALIAVAVYPAPTRTVRLLSARPLRWVGQRSYGIYLAHWPVIVFLADAPGEQPDSPPAVAVQVALALALAAASYRFVELPIRRHGLRGWWRAVRRRIEPVATGTGAARVASLAVAGVAAVGAAVVVRDVATASAPQPAQPASVVITADTTVPPGTTVPADTATTRAPAAAPEAPPPTTAPPTTAPPAPTGFAPTTAVGDSVLVGAAPALAARMGPVVAVDAAIGRQMADADEVVADLAARGQLGQVVVVHLGNNGPFTADEIDAVFAAIGPDRTVLLVNVLVPRRWEGEVNDALAAAVGRHPNAVLVDWRGLVASEPGLTRDDGYHLTAAGAERYADLVVGHVPRV